MDWEGLRCGMSLWIDNVKCVHILIISSPLLSIFQADLKFKIRNSFLIHTLDPHFRGRPISDAKVSMCCTVIVLAFPKTCVFSLQ